MSSNCLSSESKDELDAEGQITEGGSLDLFYIDTTNRQCSRNTECGSGVANGKLVAKGLLNGKDCDTAEGGCNVLTSDQSLKDN